MSVEQLTDLLLDKVTGDRCLYESDSRSACISTNKFPDVIRYERNNRPAGWCEICWLRVCMENMELEYLKLQSECLKMIPMVKVVDRLVDDVVRMVVKEKIQMNYEQLELPFVFDKDLIIQKSK